MSNSARMAAYWRAKERQYRAIAESFSLDPMYDDDETERAQFVATYTEFAGYAAACAEACEQPAQGKA